jgi:tetratricopeptide (TPR) repeat protein
MNVRQWSPRLAAIAIVAASVSSDARQFPSESSDPRRPFVASSASVQAVAPELLFEQAKRDFEKLNYQEALPLLDKVIVLLLGANPPRPDLLTQGYEMRARARFAQGDSQGAEQDFSALLQVTPSHRLGAGISPRVIALFENVRKITVGSLLLSVTPPGDILIDGRPYTAGAGVSKIDLPAGEHQITSARPGYSEVSQRFTITAGQDTPLTVSLERLSSTLTIVTVPSGVEVVLNGQTRGQTSRGDGATEMSAPLVLTDIPPGNHRLLLRRECHRDLEQTLNMERADDYRPEPLKLTPSMATVKLTAAAGADGTIYIDGAPRGAAPAEFTICEGPHVIEVRGSKGRFIDRREWRAGDAVTLTADLKSAYAIVAATGSSPAAMDRLRLSVERTLAPARRMLLFVPADADLTSAIGNDERPSEWLLTDMIAPPGTPPRFPRDTKRDLGRKLASRLGVQGVAVVSAAESNPNQLSIWLLAAGSGEADRLNVDIADSPSRARAVEFLSSTLPPLVRPSLQTSLVDLPGVKGAVVIRAAAAGAKSGLATGDTVVSAGGTPVASVGELRARIASLKPGATELPMEVRNATGQSRKVAGVVATVPDAIPLRDPTLSYNRALFDLQDQLDRATTPIAQAAVRVNLAIANIRLGNWEDALGALEQAKLPDGPGVSAGTVAYLQGLSFEALGRTADAQAAFKRAAAAVDARLSYEGPLVAPLAQQKLRGR